ncbi:DNA-directed DNA polymerase [Tanacetum coccineum]|uniref:DNA-directed DNA polymerase n=1 Tax=Tanacetum coccineum TaxID=301880 RepID=A0ABQ5GIC8_9ASTR
MPKYAKFLKGLLSNKARLEEACTVTMNERCSAVLLNKLPSKEKDPGSFTIPCDIGHLHIDNALADLGASISLMPYTMYEKLGLGEPKPTRMSLELADRSIQYPRGIAEDVLIKIDKFVLPIDFVILDMREDSRIPIILGRPFLATFRAMIDVFNKMITLKVGSEEKQEETLNEHLYSASAIEIDEKRPELKDIPSQLENAYLEGDESCPVIISSKLTEKEKTLLLQRRLNPKVQDVVKDEIVRLLDSGLIYPISDSPWVSPIHVVPKKGGMAVVLNDKELFIIVRTETGWLLHFRFFQIPIAPEDQEKTTFTCPYGTFAYRRMPFGLCNAPTTFQRCMTAIFHDMVEDFMEVFMDDFSVFGELAEEEIKDKFPDEHLMILKTKLNDEEPWYADYVNYIVGKVVPLEWTPEKKTRFFSQVKNYYWDEPYAFRLCPDNVMRRCIAGSKILEILAHCHSGPTWGKLLAIVPYLLA